MKAAWAFFIKYWKMFVAVLGIIFGAFLLRPGRSTTKDATLNGLKEAEDKIREKRIEEQAKQATQVDTTIQEMNQNPPQTKPAATDAKTRSEQSIDDIKKDYDKL